MTFLAALIALSIERFFHWGQLRQWQWFLNYQNWLNKKIGHYQPRWLLAIYVLPLALLVGLISCALSNALGGVLHVIFGTIILLYCLGPQNLWVQTYQILAALNQNDATNAINTAQTAFGVNATQNNQSFHHALLSALFIAANKRIFSVIFWFAILGPMGALLYRTIAICAISTPALIEHATKAQKYLDWLPVRVLTFFFALTGHFSKVFLRWRDTLKEGVNNNETVLTECGMAALDALNNNNQIPEDGSAERETLLLFDRTFVLTLVILAIGTLLI